MIGKLMVVGIVSVISLSVLAGINDPGTGTGAGLDVEPTPAIEATPTPEPPTPTATPVQNREDCGEIRGTDYFSREERQWFLANCVRD